VTDPVDDVPRAVHAAVLARLQASVTPFYDGQVPLDGNGRPVDDRYGVVWFQTRERGRDDLSGTADRFVHRWQVTSVGTDREQVEWVATRCQDALLDEPLLVPGWEIALVEHSSSGPIRIDRDIPGTDVFYGVDTFTVTTTR
jgi:hypothetical protein